MSELPVGWAEANLLDLCCPKQWKVISTAELTDAGYVVYGANGKIGFYSTYTHESPTLMITCRGATCGNLHISEPRSYINGNAMALDDLAEQATSITYLKYALQARGLTDAITGSAQPQITRQSLSEVAVRLAPLAEQTRIAQKLDELLAQVDKLRARIDALPVQLKRFRRSVLAAAVSGRLTEEWRQHAPFGEKMQIGELVDCVSGNGFPPAMQGQNEGDYPFAKVSDISSAFLKNSGRMNTAANWVTENEAKELRAKVIPCGATAFAKIGEGLKLNRRVLIQRPMLIDNNCMALLPKSEQILSNYLYYFMRTIDLGQFAIATAVPSIRRGDIERIEIVRPNLNEQAEIVRRVEQLFAFADQLEAKVASAKSRIDHLTQSILAKAFRGELVPQDPNDEPASVLLERIQAQRAATPKAKRGRKASA